MKYKSKVEATIHYKKSWLLSEKDDRKDVIETLLKIRKKFSLFGCNIIELGSGIGTNLKIFKKDCDVLGIEGLPEVAALACSEGISTIVANLEEDLDFSIERASAVLCIDILEHLHSPGRCLKLARDVIEDNGILIINIPNHFDWRGRMNILRGSGIDSQRFFPTSSVWEYPHVRFFRKKDVFYLLECSGFRVIEDYSNIFNSFPKIYLLRKIGFSWIARLMQKYFPDVFTYGFFLVAQKQL